MKLLDFFDDWYRKTSQYLRENYPQELRMALEKKWVWEERYSGYIGFFHRGKQFHKQLEGDYS